MTPDFNHISIKGQNEQLIQILKQNMNFIMIHLSLFPAKMPNGFTFLKSSQPMFPELWQGFVVIPHPDRYQQKLPARPGLDQKEQVPSCPAASMTSLTGDKSTLLYSRRKTSNTQKAHVVFIQQFGVIRFTSSQAVNGLSSLTLDEMWVVFYVQVLPF